MQENRAWNRLKDEELTVKRTPYGYTGIDDARVKVLANAIEKWRW